MRLLSSHEVAIWMLFFAGIDAATRTLQQDLIDSLLDNYNRFARPTLDDNQPVVVDFGAEIIQLITVDDRAQFITTKAWIRQGWKNELLKWNATAWNGTSVVRVDAGLLWYPDILLYNSADAKFPGGIEKYKTQIMMYPDGYQFWMSPVTFSSTCTIDVTHFPFDRQECVMKFGSWTNDNASVEMRADSRDVVTSLFVNNSEWEMASAMKVRNAIKYACCDNPYIDVSLYLRLHRKPLYYVTNAIAPCFVLMVMVLFSFFLPPESGERISLTITILLAVALFLQLVSSTLPKNSDSVPRLATFYMVVMVESGLSLVTTCLVLVMHSRGSSGSALPMSNWMRVFFLEKLARLFSVYGRPDLLHSEASSQNEAAGITPKRQRHSNGKVYVDDVSGTRNGGYGGHEIQRDSALFGTQHEGELHHRSNGKSTETNISQYLKSLDSHAESFTSSLKEQHYKEKVLDEWRYLGKVLDRLFFWVFLVSSVVASLVLILPSYLQYAYD